ncbi:hypothetical protein HYC85_024576 [Camellia sinensis]|uniref:Inhibitor I9 domain-containing protein n=1 Tax=Camellia sinensis TaxID=4442 RepID=A0A7J7G8I2_CAMSI|nr:hypothetical protein HYC85_024576 [Camellia sinensis]
MEKKILIKFLILLSAVLGFFHVSTASMEKKNNVQKRTYIVHMAKSQMPASFDEHTHWYDSSLKSVSDSAEMLYTYDIVVHGFSTRLTVEESQSLESQPGILGVFPETKYELHTTRTPRFLGLDMNPDLLPKSDAVSEIIVGVLDTGVWPEIKSFDDTGLGPVPSEWKGTCESGTNFTASNCNRKLIGARFFSKGYEAAVGPIDTSHESKSPRDDDGHGTHTSGTAAGSVVVGASLFGYASGSARGMASSARLAMYKVCWRFGCFGSDVLAAMDKASRITSTFSLYRSAAELMIISETKSQSELSPPWKRALWSLAQPVTAARLGTVSETLLRGSPQSVPELWTVIFRRSLASAMV